MVQALGQETPHDRHHHPQSQSRKLRPWEVKRLAHGHPAGKWQCLGSESPGSKPHAVSLTAQLPVTWQSWQGLQAWVGPLRIGPGQICHDACQGGSGRWPQYSHEPSQRAFIPKGRAGCESRWAQHASAAARHQRAGWGKRRTIGHGSLDRSVLESCLCHFPAVWLQISDATPSASVSSLKKRNESSLTAVLLLRVHDLGGAYS